MKKILLFALVLVSLQGFGQGVGLKLKTPIIGFESAEFVPIAGYTKIFARYEWVAGAFDSGLHVPQYNGVPSGVRSGVWQADGAIAMDSLNGYFYQYWNGAWVKYAKYSDLSSSAQLEMYKNSAMTDSVMCFVYRDSLDVISRVYEPLRNNDVRLKTYTDKFPFDNTNCYNNTINDVNFIDVASDVIIQGCTLETMIIDGKSKTGLQLINHNQQGNYGLTESNNEIVITGNNVQFINNTIAVGNFFDSCGINSVFQDIHAAADNLIYCNGFTTTIKWGILNSNSTIENRFNGGGMQDFYIGTSCNVYFGSAVYTLMTLNESVILGSSTKSFTTVSGVTVGAYTTIIPDTDNVYDLLNANFGGGFNGANALTITQTTDGLTRLLPNVGIGTSTPAKIFHTVGTVRHASLGTASTDTTTYKPLGIDSNGDVFPMTNWFGGGAATPTWQQTLTAGSTLTGNNTITGANNTFTFNYGANSSAFALYGASTGGYTLNTKSAYLSTNEVTSQAVHSSGNQSYHRITNIRTGAQTDQYIYSDSILYTPHLGQMNIDTLRTWSAVSDTTYKKPMTWDTRNGRWEYASNWFGGGAGASGITIGTTTITSGTNTRILYNNSGVVGEYTVTGSGTEAVLSTAPTFVTSATSPILYGSSAANGDLAIHGTSSGTKATSTVSIQSSGGNVGIGTGTVTSPFAVEILGSATNTSLLNLNTAESYPVWINMGSAFGANGYFTGNFKGVNYVMLSDGNFVISAGAQAIQTYNVTEGNKFARRVQELQGADVASVAGAITLGNDGNTFEITGTNAITLISSTDWQNGSVIHLVFTSTATLTDGTANSGANIGMELAGGANFTASADDIVTLVLSEVGGTQRWREISRSVN